MDAEKMGRDVLSSLGFGAVAGTKGQALASHG
jgi:hypothetical protein